MKRAGIYFICIVINLFSQQAAIAEKGDDYVNDKIWEQIFKIISENSKEDPYTWISKQLGKESILQKGNTLILGHDYFITVDNSMKKQNKIYLENERTNLSKFLLKQKTIYILSDKGLVNKSTDGYCIIIIQHGWLFIVNLEKDLVSRVKLPSN